MKQTALILVFTILLLSLSSCSVGKKVPEMPKDTNLEFWITQDVSGTDFSKHHEIIGWFGARQYYGSGYQPVFDENGYEADPEYYVKYLITAWPDYADGGSYITLIEFNDPKVTVYGLTVDSSFDEFEHIFAEMGYEISKEGSDHFESITASKNGIAFILESVNGRRKFSIEAEVTNKEGIVY